ncbi:MAG: CoA-binding protein [archaeon]|nr:CoA-binding protein [archaeon]
MKTIAILGASAKKEKFGNKCVRAYKQLGWKIFPINPNEKEIEGIKCYSSIKEILEKPDRVSIYLHSQITLSLIPELKEAGIQEVMLNPGAESDELISELKKNNITPIKVCSIRIEGIDPDSL